MAGETPKLRIECLCQRVGRAEFIRRCGRLLAGADDEAEILVALGGNAAVRLLGDDIPDGQRYWLRVWAARGLLWAGTEGCDDALRRATRDDSWRVREMVCKVVARHQVEDVFDDVIALESDPNSRVRLAARRAVIRVIEADRLRRTIDGSRC